MAKGAAKKNVQQMAQAVIEEKIREGTWEGAIRPLTQYQDNPIGFAVEELGLRRDTLVWSENPGYGPDFEWDGTPDPIARMAREIEAGNDVAVESATGAGKSHALGWLQLWFLASWQGARTFSFASKEEQLDLYSWTEIKKLWPRFERLFPTAEMTHLRIRMAGGGEEGKEAGWGAVGRSAGVGAEEEIAAKAAGMHGTDMLICMEEMQGLPLPIARAVAHTSVGAHNIRIGVGNPDNQHDTLHRFATEPDVTHIRISALDHPNIVVNNHRDPEWNDLANDVEIVPGAVSRKSIRRREQKHGKDSRFYQTRVRGISPAESEEALIRWEWCEAAATRQGDPSLKGPPALGVDVANSPTGDKSAVARWEGACLTEVWSGRLEDASALGRMVYDEAISRDISPKHIGVDPVGVGASTINELKKFGLKVQPIDARYRAIPTVDVEAQWRETETDEDGKVRPAGPAVVETERFGRLRDQVWWRLREDLRLGRIALPDDEELFEDLTAPTFEVKNGKIYVEPKKDLKQRIGRSPDKGDAAAFGNFVRPRRPEREKAKQERHQNAPNVDRGLERLASRRRKQVRHEKRELDRLRKSLGQTRGRR